MVLVGRLSLMHGSKEILKRIKSHGTGCEHTGFALSDIHAEKVPCRVLCREHQSRACIFNNSEYLLHEAHVDNIHHPKAVLGDFPRQKCTLIKKNEKNPEKVICM